MAERGRPRSFDRAAALRRAMEMFWARGYDGASMTDLTAAMGINSPSLYAAFGCKEALFREALELYEAGEGGTASRTMQQAPTARAGIEAMLRENAAGYTAPDRPPGCMIVLASAVGIPASPEVREYLLDSSRRSVANVKARLDRGVAEGDVPKGADTQAIATYYVTVLNGLTIQARNGAGCADLQAVVDSAMAGWDVLVAPRS
ncbi:TetR/AcrR family transcriptional regulator [Inquilinus limosus]|uniref:TetR family transcriptional regulator n=1 Tax=Inquilinus limosus MP06 TaxID=1398085 RepID=A0A0A0D483_9PROT|nr:TetR/AcrR family transcriptional regulator [Inquilinus limosus]KGM32909.1 TetR family transcriptional regulator [Inquilinus limosus MP06]